MPVTTTGKATEFITFSRASLATVTDSDGKIKWAGHNLVLNSASPATQTITVVSGTIYTVECTGTGSVALSGAGTGTVSSGSPVTITASTTSLTLTVSGTVSTMWAYRSGLGGMVLNPATGTTYYASTGSVYNAPRLDYDPATFAAKGLLMEEQRTNLLLNSATLSTQNVTVSAVAYTLSFWGTGTVTLSGTSTAGPLVGTAANNRVTLTFTPTAGTLTLTVSGTVSQAQLEAGSFATSYIPTTSASVTRSADVASVATSAFPYSATEGALILNATPASGSVASGGVVATINGPTSSDCAIVGRAGGTGVGLTQVFTASTLQAYLVSSATNDGVSSKYGYVYAANDFAFTVNGSSPATDTAGTVPAAARLYLGSNDGLYGRWNGWIRQITYIPRRLTNAELQARTA